MDYYKRLIYRFLALIAVTLAYPLYYPILGVLTLYGSSLILGLMGYILGVNPINLYFIIGDVQFNIIEACVAVFAYFLLAILVLTTKGIKFKDGLKIFGLGFILLLLGNVVRIVVLTMVYLEFGADAFYQSHFLVWSFVSGIYVALVWIFLVVKFKIKEIPIVSDLKVLYNKSLFKKGKHSKRK